MKEHSNKHTWDIAERSKINVIVNPERKEKDIGIEAVFEEITANRFPNWWKTSTYRFRKLSKLSSIKQAKPHLGKLLKNKDKELFWSPVFLNVRIRDTSSEIYFPPTENGAN